MSDAAHPKVTQLIDLWRRLHPGPDLLPGRQHFDPMQVPALLPNIWLLDVLPGPPRRFRYRLIGSRLIEAGIPGRKGDYVDDPRFSATPAAVTALWERVADSRAPDWFRGKPFLQHSNYVETIERISLPFAADGRVVDLIMNLTLFHWNDGTIR